ncbi:MAG TPA: hypothetical protein VMC83_24450 [Streptosporangiaceae bacterium]|nr:hypothetical protein [Streptosporangiaceae bacterium]
MAVDSGASSGGSLSGLAGQILREAVRAYDTDGIERLVTGYTPVLAAWNTGMFAATGDMTGSFRTIGFAVASQQSEVSLSRVFRLGKRLPAVRLPAAAELAALARTAPLMTRLEALALWLGQDGRPVAAAGDLSPADATEAARVLGIGLEYLLYLWEYALTAHWVEFEDGPGEGESRAVPGFTAWRWASGDDVSTLRVWAAVFAAVAAQALEVGAYLDPKAARKVQFHGQGVVVAALLFLDRRTGMTVSGIRDVIRDGALGGRKSARARRRWDAWIRDHGDPAGWLLSELAALYAVELPPGADGSVQLAPLALWALREQLRLEGIEIPQIIAARDGLRAADLVAMADGVPEAEFEAEVGAWVTALGADQAARDLLAFATFSGPQLRLVAVNLTRRLGSGAQRAWRDAMQRPELRGYAQLALSVLAADLPDTTAPMVLQPEPDDLTSVATDLLALACGEEDPDPDEVAAQFAEAVPPGEEAWVIDQMSRGSHPDVVGVLSVLGRYHPDRRVAKLARRAAREAARNRPPARADRVPARAAGR